MKKAAYLLAIIVELCIAGPASALQLSPDDFTSLGSLVTTTDIVINTDTLQLSGGASFTGLLDPTSHATVFTFDTIQAGNISVIGSNPLALLSKGDAIFNGIVTSANTGRLQIAAAGTVSVASGASISVLNGSALSIFSQDLQIAGEGNVVSGGNLTLATTGGLVTRETTTTGQLLISSLSGTNLFHSFNVFNVQSGEVQLFSSGDIFGNTILRGAILESGSSQPLIVGIASVPEPTSVLLLASGLSGIAWMWKRKEVKSQDS